MDKNIILDGDNYLLLMTKFIQIYVIDDGGLGDCPMQEDIINPYENISIDEYNNEEDDEYDLN